MSNVIQDPDFTNLELEGNAAGPLPGKPPDPTPLSNDGIAVHPTPFSKTYQSEGGEIQYVGEYRGWYGNSRWKPADSKFWHQRGSSGSRPHKGIDIYCREGTELVASVAGKVTLRPDTDNNGAGNRILLVFTWKGEQWILNYMHLSKFLVSNGASVSPGQPIALSGCSGNANTNLDCTNPNKCGGYSSHVHIQLYKDTRTYRDPSIALQWNLKYFDFDKVMKCRNA